MAEEINPDGSANEEYWQAREVEAAERNLAGLEHRVVELEGMEAVTQDQLDEAAEAVKSGKEHLTAAKSARTSAKKEKAVAEKKADEPKPDDEPKPEPKPEAEKTPSSPKAAERRPAGQGKQTR